MKTAYLTLCALASLLLLACSHEADTILTFESGSQQVIDNKLEFNAGGGEANLFFTTNEGTNPDISVSYPGQREPEWLIATGSIVRGKGEITFICEENSTTRQRETAVQVKVGNASFTVKVVQRPVGIVKTQQTDYVVRENEQTLEIGLTANGELTFATRFDCPAWIQHTVTGQGENVKLQLSIDANKGLGRVAFVDVYVDGQKKLSISLRQQPAAFAEEVVMPDVKAGSLFVQLGDDAANLCRIRRLTIIGHLNALDLQVLRQRLLKSGLAAQSYPLHLDLHWTYIEKGDECHYPGLNPELSENPPYVKEASLPSSLFSYASDLVSLELPESLEEIGEHCFQGCTGLERISIPESVVAIGEYAFKSCSKLEEIEISPYSKLTSLGEYAFATGTRLKSLVLPVGLTQVSKFTFRSCHADTLRLDWEVPPVWEITPKGKTLSVPSGTKQAYESAPNWNGFENIIEHDL